MSNYFSMFPTVQHDLTNVGQKVTLTNILRRFKVRSDIKDRLDTYYNYDIQAGDRPDTIAEKYYGDASYAWVILHYNDRYDAIFDWPLFNNDFEEYIKGKYGGIAASQATVHEYRRIISQKETKVNGVVVPERYVVVDKTTFDTLDEINKQSISKWDYEILENEKKRKIKILDKRYLNQIVAEAEDILRNGV
jgi:hypothetical protein